MRVVRSLLGGCVGIVAFIVVVTTLSSTPPTGPAIHSLVSHTNHQLHQLHTLKAELEGKMTNNAKYLNALGFVDKPIQYPHHTWDNITTPVLATAVSSGELWQVEGLINHAASVAPNLTVAVYTLDISQQEIDKLENMCNLTCLVIKFDFNAYPSHLRDLKLKAFRPVIIQELLLRSGAVLWLDAKIRLAESEGYAGTKSPQTEESGGSWMVASSNDMSEWSRRAVKSGGVLAWPLKEPQLMPTSALTHPNMFTFFHTPKHNYDFHQMSDASTVLVYNLPHVHKELMKPWVGCALTHNCISPIGAQDTGCRYDKKPLFRYSGCHHYDESAFNVALGVMFDQDTRPYLAPTNPFIIASKSQRTPLIDDTPEEDNRDLSSREMFSKDLSTSHDDQTPKQISGIPTSKQIGREKELEHRGASSLINRIINNVSSGKS